jgi:hypothetical protein
MFILLSILILNYFFVIIFYGTLHITFQVVNDGLPARISKPLGLQGWQTVAQ